MSPVFEALRYVVVDHIATITIDRPERRNALTWAVVVELSEAFTVAKDDPEVRVVVLTGAGEQAFCAGADLAGVLGDGTFLERHDARGELGRLLATMWALGKPTVARVRGHALAGGFGLALACDLVVAADDAVFGTPEIDVGMWPMMITVAMQRSMPPKVALELQMTGRRVDAHEGARLGFVNKVVTVEQLDAAVAELAGTLASKSPAIMRLGRDAFYRVLGRNVDDALERLQVGLTMVNETDDSKEGISAFLEKRRPRWAGR
jgi:enoyl-CoA hydratase/carnithine racemase